MRLLLSAFAPSMGDAPEKHRVVTGVLPPLAPGHGGLDIDFSLLFVAEQLVFDRYSYERLREYKTPSALRVQDSLEILHDEGFLVLQDYGKLAEEHEAFRDRGVELVTQNISAWLPSVKMQIHRFDKLVTEFSREFSADMSEWDLHTYGIATFLLETEGRVDAERARNLRELILGTRQRRRKASENAQLAGVVRTVVRHVYTNLLIADRLQCIPYTWGTVGAAYDAALAMAAHNVTEETRSIQACNQFFTVAFREFAPRAARDWIRTLKHPKATELRARISQAVAENETLDNDFAKRSFSELAAAHERLSRLKRYSALGALVGGLVGGVLDGPLGGIAGGLAGTALPSAAQELIDRVQERKVMSKYGWMYFTEDRQRAR